MKVIVVQTQDVTDAGRDAPVTSVMFDNALGRRRADELLASARDRNASAELHGAVRVEHDIEYELEIDAVACLDLGPQGRCGSTNTPRVRDLEAVTCIECLRAAAREGERVFTEVMHYADGLTKDVALVDNLRSQPGVTEYNSGRFDSAKYKGKIAKELRTVLGRCESDAPPAPKQENGAPVAEWKPSKEGIYSSDAGIQSISSTEKKLDELLTYARAAEERRRAVRKPIDITMQDEQLGSVLRKAYYGEFFQGQPHEATEDAHAHATWVAVARALRGYMAPASRIDVNSPHGDLVTRVWAHEGFEPGIVEHYKGGRYTALAVAEMHESRWPFVVYYSHTKKTLNLRPLKPIVDAYDAAVLGKVDYADAWLTPVSPSPNTEVQRFTPVPGSMVLNMVRLVKELAE